MEVYSKRDRWRSIRVERARRPPKQQQEEHMGEGEAFSGRVRAALFAETVRTERREV